MLKAGREKLYTSYPGKKYNKSHSPKATQIKSQSNDTCKAIKENNVSLKFYTQGMYLSNGQKKVSVSEQDICH